MRTTSLIRFIEDSPIFKDLTPEQLKIIEGCASNRHIEEGEYIAREGAQCDSFYLLRTGQVAVEIDIPLKGRSTVQSLHEGDVLGWS